MEAADLSERLLFDGKRSLLGSAWTFTDFPLFVGVDPDTRLVLERLLTTRVRLHKGGLLYRAGDRSTALYAIRSGSCKTVLLARDGQSQVAGYHLIGDLIGVDGIGAQTHDCQAIALEDMEVCPLPYVEIEHLVRRSPPFQRNVQRLLAQEGARARVLMLMLGTMRAEQRLAVFLLDMSQRYLARGYSSCEFVLRMTRQEIGSYLGLKLETVSRLLSRFQLEGMIQVQGRAVKLLDRGAVIRLVDCDILREPDTGAGMRRRSWSSSGAVVERISPTPAGHASG